MVRCLIHKNESGPVDVNQVIFATTQLSEDYLIIISQAAKPTRAVFTIYENKKMVLSVIENLEIDTIQ